MKHYAIVLLLFPLFFYGQKPDPKGKKLSTPKINSENVNSLNNNKNSFNTTNITNNNYYGLVTKSYPTLSLKFNVINDKTFLNIEFDNIGNIVGFNADSIRITLKKIWKITPLNIGSYNSNTKIPEEASDFKYIIDVPINSDSYTTTISIDQKIPPTANQSVKVWLRSDNIYFNFDFAILADVQVHYKEKVKCQGATVLFMLGESDYPTVQLGNFEIVHTPPVYKWMSDIFQDNQVIAKELSQTNALKDKKTNDFILNYGDNIISEIKQRFNSVFYLRNKEAIIYSQLFGKGGKIFSSNLIDLSKKWTNNTAINSQIKEAQNYIQTDTFQTSKRHTIDPKIYMLGRLYWEHTSDFRSISKTFKDNDFLRYRIKIKPDDYIEFYETDSTKAEIRQQIEAHIESLDSVTRKKSDEYTTLRNRARAEFDLKHYDASLNLFKQMEIIAISMKFELDEISAYYVGQIYLLNLDYSNAIKYFTSSLNRFEYDEMYNNRGWAYYKLYKNDLAIADFTEAIKHHIHDEIPYYNRALTFIRLKKNAEAINDLLVCIDTNPDLEDYYIELIKLYDEMKETEKANLLRNKLVLMVNERQKFQILGKPYSQHIYRVH